MVVLYRIFGVCVSVQSACSYFLVRPGNSEIILPFRALLPSLFSPNPLQISLMPYSVRLVRARFTKIHLVLIYYLQGKGHEISPEKLLNFPIL